MQIFVQIAIWLISYFLSKKAGATKAQAAMLATGATLLSNSTGLTDTISGGLSKWFGGGAGTSATNPTSIGTGSNSATLGAVGSGTGNATGVADVLKSWGPAGTALVGATATGAITKNKTLLYGGLAILGLLILRK